jgi:RNA polymerase subunit RPABC4/transcription elongation factor Spt4
METDVDIEMVMCRSCGEFTTAVMEDGKRIPRADECPECGGTEFKDIHEDSIIKAGDDD